VKQTIALAALLAAAVLVPLGDALLAGAEAQTHAPPAHETTASPSHLQVTEVEYRLLLSRSAVHAGAVDLEQLDAGQDAHDLRLKRNGSGPTIYGRLLSPGKRWDGVVHLTPGVYTLWCSLPEHRRLGMHATLRVVG
jgi:hypothetical protein